MRTLLASLSSISLAAACAAPSAVPATAKDSPLRTASPKEIVGTALHELLVKRDISAVDRYWDPGYVQHNPMMPDGSAIVRQMVEAMPGFTSKTVRLIADGDMVVIHNRVTGAGPATI